MKNKLLLFSAFLMAAIAAEGQVNLIVNGDFEASDGWIVMSQMVKGDAAIVNQNPEIPLDNGGDKSMRLHGNNNVLTTAKTYYSRDVVLSVEKKVYTLTFWARGKNADMDIYLSLVGKNSDGVNKVDLGNGIFSIPSDDIWRQYTKVLDYTSGIITAGTTTDVLGDVEWDFSKPFTFRIGIAGPQDMTGKNAYVMIDNVSITEGNTSGVKKREEKSSHIFGTAAGIVINGVWGEVSVYGLTGSMVKSEMLHGNAVTFSLPKGIYLVKVKDSEVLRVIL